jgi:hypothetical protein
LRHDQIPEANGAVEIKSYKCTHLPVLARRLGGRLGKQVEVQLSIHALAAVAGRASRQTAECAEAGEAAPAAAGLEAIVVVIRLLGRCLFGRVVCWAQDGGNVERSQLAGVVGLGRSRRGTIRSAERRDLTAVGTGAQLLLELSLLRLRGGMRLGGDVRLLVVLRQLRVEVGAICWLLLIRQPGHYEVGSHYTVLWTGILNRNCDCIDVRLALSSKKNKNTRDRGGRLFVVLHGRAVW